MSVQSLWNVWERKRFEPVRNQLRRATGRGNYWYWMDAPELHQGIALAELVCPLRYDVIVRRDFFPFYVLNRDLYLNDFAEFVRQVAGTRYYIWYMQSEAVRSNRQLRGNPRALQAGLADRVRRAVELFESVRTQGFRPEFPIVLKTAEQLLPPTTDRGGAPTAKRVRARYFLADGCHRVALLMALGHTTLPANYFRVKCFREFSPFDSTSLLARALPLDEPTYFRYLSTLYAAPHSFIRRDEFLNYIRTNKLADHAEVLSVLRADGFES